jgi:hypothetical protein
MHTAERLTGTIRGHRKAIACLSGALVLASAGTASAATLAPAGHVAVAAADPAPVAVQPAHADTTLRAGVVAVVSGRLTLPGTLGQPRSAVHPGQAADPARTAKHARRSRPAASPAALATHPAGAHHGQAVVAPAGRPARPAFAVRRLAPASARLLPVATAGPQNVMPITPAQYANAAAIVHTALAKRMGARSAVIAVATAMQESRLLNLSYGTGDSLGLFQQQWDMGWGTPQQIMNPAYAAGKFLDALRGYQATDPAWASQPLYQTAQGVQRSGFPFAYAQWERQAAQLTASVLHRR